MPDSWMPADGDGLHALDETQQHRRGDGYGVVDPGGGACEVTVNSGVLAQSDTLTVASGDVLVSGTTFSLATQTLSLDSASETNPRRDVVYVDTSGVVQVAKGTPEAVDPSGQSLTRFEFYRPAPPDLASTDGAVLAEVWIPTGASSIQSADVRDRRLRALGPHSLDEDIATQSELNAHAGNAGVHHAKDHDHTEAGISAVPTGGLVDDTVTVAGNAVALGGSTAIAHGDLSTAPTNAHHSEDHDHTTASVSAVPNAGLVDDTVTVAGNAVALGGSTAITHGDLSGIGTDDHHAQDHDHTTASVSPVPNAGLVNDTVTVTAGNGLKNGGGVSLGGSVTVDIEPADFAGQGVSDDGTDTLTLALGAGVAFDGSDQLQVDAGNGLELSSGAVRINPAGVSGAGLKEISATTMGVEPADFAGAFLSDDGSDNLQVDTGATIENDGSGNARVRERFNYDPGVTQLEAGQTNTELNRVVLQSGETLTIERVELRGQGGGSSASVDIDVFDASASNQIASQTLGGTTKNPGSSGTGNTVTIRYSNSSGSQSDAAPRVIGYIEGA